MSLSELISTVDECHFLMTATEGSADGKVFMETERPDTASTL